MKKRISAVTFHYMIITGGFWMAFCVVTAYAAVFLHGAGYDDQELGIILALGNVGGAVMSPVLGAWIDRNRKIRHAQLVFALLGMQMILLAALRINPQKNLLCTICYVLYMTFMMPVNALNLDLCVRLERAKAPLNFGLARSMGSFSFVILSTLLGILTEQLGYRMLPFAGMAVVALQGIGNRLIDRDLRDAENSLPQSETVLQERSSSLADFIRENKSFCLMLFGTIIIFIAHNTDGNFLINLVENVGGGPAVMGYLAAFTAIVEVPVMMLSDKLPKRWSRVQYIRLAFVCTEDAGVCTGTEYPAAVCQQDPAGTELRTVYCPDRRICGRDRAAKGFCQGTEPGLQYDDHRIRAGKPDRRKHVQDVRRETDNADRNGIRAGRRGDCLCRDTHEEKGSCKIRPVCITEQKRDSLNSESLFGYRYIIPSFHQPAHQSGQGFLPKRKKGSSRCFL